MRWVFFCLMAWIGDFKALEVNIFARENGYGLAKDGLILKKAIEIAGHQAKLFGTSSERAKEADINIYFENFDKKQFPKARKNWFIPNPEWFLNDLDDIPLFDLILCRTREVERVFKPFGVDTYYIGFTSFDCFDKRVHKDFSRWFHLSGGSVTKATPELLTCWSERKTLPHLWILRHDDPPSPVPQNVTWNKEYLPEEDLRKMQNQCGIHVCTSLTEGFGHYLSEAMSTGAVVITTDAPPMNEFIQDKRCLVPYKDSYNRSLAICYLFDPVKMEEVVRGIQKLSRKELEEIGKQNRNLFLNRIFEFQKRLEELLNLQS